MIRSRQTLSYYFLPSCKTCLTFLSLSDLPDMWLGPRNGSQDRGHQRA